ncbi:type II secretion system protein N [Marinobacter qingdaonensis]|uniref:Type II secretion system protein N n=1 Tax=Marinobacter qingdaonensis TaxID=3108486 RepID=A0ABU5P0B5_9GAMM|nr:type II secretion system protein N [Marinobacter sp. ASW11-75]MEA1081483.1 type II secretion system protein N [Marinobacter sp. ASW11-75]
MNDATPKPFLRPGKLILLTLLALVVYAITLLVWIPAGWVWQQVAPRVSLPQQLEVRQVSGRLWDGAAGLVVAGYPIRVDWQLGWPSLTGLSLPLDLNVATAQSRINGKLKLSWPQKAEVSATGQIVVSEFEELIRRSGGAMIEGNVTIDRLNLVWEDNRVTLAEGLGRWAGGQVTWPMGNQTGQARFPAMRADLDTTQGGIALAISEQGGSGPAAEASILWSGMMELRVFKRMVDLAGQPWSDSASPGDVIFRVRQPLLPGAR